MNPVYEQKMDALSVRRMETAMPPPERSGVPEVTSALNELRAELGTLREEIKRLAERTEPVRRAAEPAEQSDSKNPVGWSTPLSAALGSLAETVRHATQELRELTDQIEV